MEYTAGPQGPPRTSPLPRSTLVVTLVSLAPAGTYRAELEIRERAGVWAWGHEVFELRRTVEPPPELVKRTIDYLEVAVARTANVRDYWEHYVPGCSPAFSRRRPGSPPTTGPNTSAFLRCAMGLPPRPEPGRSEAPPQ